MLGDVDVGHLRWHPKGLFAGIVEIELGEVDLHEPQVGGSPALKRISESGFPREALLETAKCYLNGIDPQFVRPLRWAATSMSPLSLKNVPNQLSAAVRIFISY
jgi:hypothetical protein